MTAEPSVQSAAGVVETPDGPVTQASIESLLDLAKQTQRAADEIANQIAQLQTAIRPMQAQAGSILVQRRSDWASSERAARIEVARGMEALIAGLQESIAGLAANPHQGVTGFIRELKDKHDIDSLKAKLQSAQSELDIRYRDVVDQLAPQTGIAEADSLLDEVRAQVARSIELSAQQKTLLEKVSQLNEEIDRRKGAVANLGFDAPAVEADLIANGLRPITTNLVLKHDEIAVASSDATLCRYRTRTQYVGSSQGISIPLGHGLRYRVSSFRGQPLQVESLSTVDQGMLVVTNQRLVFLGNKRDVSVPVAKLLQIQAFSNGLAIGREGKESRDIYLVAHPAYVTLYLHWVASHQS